MELLQKIKGPSINLMVAVYYLEYKK